MAGGSVWVALEAGADPVASARALRVAHGRFFTGDGAHEPPGGVRSVIAASWRRSTRAGVAPDAPAAAPVVLDESAVADHRERSGLAAALPLVSDLVGLRTREARHVLIVTDVLGHLLWVEGDRELRRRSAERVELVPGALWDERAAGTNAMGTALARARERRRARDAGDAS